MDGYLSDDKRLGIQGKQSYVVEILGGEINLSVTLAPVSTLDRWVERLRRCRSLVRCDIIEEQLNVVHTRVRSCLGITPDAAESLCRCGEEEFLSVGRELCRIDELSISHQCVHLQRLCIDKQEVGNCGRSFGQPGP